jgi:hypothetical protein
MIAACGQNPVSADKPVHIPINMWRKNVNGVWKPRIDIGLGNLKPLPFGFDTGSTGLHVFAAANLMKPASGVRCTDEPADVTYGNPPRITYVGVVCYAVMHFEGYTTPEPVKIAYLTSAKCTPQNPNCSIPDLHDPVARGGYGVFGAGITGKMPIPNPFLTLPEPYGSRFGIRLTRKGGDVVLGAPDPANAVKFHFPPGTVDGAKWSRAQTCLLVNGKPIDKCLEISFDTGNPVPWIHDASTAAIPLGPQGFIKPSTRIGFAPKEDPSQSISVVAGATRYENQINVLPVGKQSMTNVAIQVFYDHVVTYDNKAGTISFAPLK